jgi:hypothetical protein
MARTPTYTPHLRLQASGVLGPAGGAWEIFSYGLSLGRSGGGLTTDEAYLSDCVDDLVAYHGRATSGISAFARLTAVKVALVQPDGSWQGAAPLYERSVDVPGGNDTGSTLMHAPQVSACVTLRTALNTPRARGRFFLPLPFFQVQASTGLAVATQVNQAAESAATLVTALNNQPGIDSGDMNVVVASTFGGINQVTQVSVGRVLDTIRSRRNALREAYLSAPVTS